MHFSVIRLYSDCFDSLDSTRLGRLTRPIALMLFHSIFDFQPPTTMDPNSSNAVVSKLQSAIANFRREKDAAQRNRDLALERLKASTATFESEQTKTTSLQTKLDDINRKISAGNGQEVAQQRAENDRLEREVSAVHCVVM